jgi:hypothetical protein
MKLSKEEKNILLELITNEQLKHLIPKDEYRTERYNKLEELKSKIREM